VRFSAGISGAWILKIAQKYEFFLNIRK